MISVEEIIARKISDRCCRRQFKESKQVNLIVQECCEDLQMPVPQIVYCETLTRSFSAFYLRNQPYIIYDSCLMEALYIYDCIIMSGNNEQDMEKLFFKLIGEELILRDDLPRSLYFSGKYRRLDYSFEKTHNKMEQEIGQMLSAQNYFLIGHELGHLYLDKSFSDGIPEGYWNFTKVCMCVLTERLIGDCSLEDFIKTRYGYFLDICPKTLDEYYELVWKSNRYKHFVDECYCDFQGLKLLLEHYKQSENSIRAISAALNYLILQEAIRSDMADQKFFFGDATHNASKSMYFSVLRIEILLLTIQYNRISNIEQAFKEIGNRSALSRQWAKLVEKIPSEESFSLVFEKDLPNTDSKKLIDTLIATFYYAHID